MLISAQLLNKCSVFYGTKRYITGPTKAHHCSLLTHLILHLLHLNPSLPLILISFLYIFSSFLLNPLLRFHLRLSFFYSRLYFLLFCASFPFSSSSSFSFYFLFFSFSFFLYHPGSRLSWQRVVGISSVLQLNAGVLPCKRPWPVLTHRPRWFHH
jgi:hypothetical protein